VDPGGGRGGGGGGGVPDGRMGLRWTLTRQEFARGMAPITRSRLPVVFLGPVAFVVFVLVTWQLAGSPPRPDATPLVVVVLAVTTLVAVLVGALIKGLLPYWLLRRQWQRNPILQDPCEALITPSEFRLLGPDTESTFQWYAFDQVSDSGPVYLLRLRGHLTPHFLVIPKRAVAEVERQAELGELLRRYVASGTKVNSGSAPAAHHPF